MSDEMISAFDASDIMDELTREAPEATFLPTVDAIPFALGEENARPVEKIVSLERMGEKLARALRAVLEPFARTHVQVTVAKPGITTYGEWQGDLPFFAQHCFSLFRMRPLKGSMLLTLEADMIVGLVESFYGGAPGGTPKPKSGDFTVSEEMLLRRLTDRLMTQLAEHWHDLAPIEPQLAQRESNIEHLSYLRADEQVVTHGFTVTPAGAQASTITFLYPLAMLRPVEARIASKVHGDGEDRGGDDLWRARLGAALSEVTLPVRSVLARPEISVAQLLALKPGDVIPIQLGPRTPLLAGSYRIADGVIGEQEGRAALMIEKVGN